MRERVSRRSFLHKVAIGGGGLLIFAAGGLAWRAWDRGALGKIYEGPAFDPWEDWRNNRFEGPLGLVSAATLFGTNRLLTAVLSWFPQLRSLVLGSPVVLVHHGKVVEEQLRRIGVTHADVMQAIRERGVCELDDVKFAVLELDGAINVIPRGPETAPRTPSGSET